MQLPRGGGKGLDVASAVIVVVIVILNVVAARHVSVTDCPPTPSDVTPPAPTMPELSSRCQPVSHDNLWRRLQREDNHLPRHRMSTVEPLSVVGDNAVDVSTATDTADFSDDGVRVHWRRRRSTRTAAAKQRSSSSDTLVNRLRSSINGGDVRTSEDSNELDSARNSSIIHLRHSRRHHKQQQQRKQHPSKSAWQCHLNESWLRMPDDVFPPFILTGSCTGARGRPVRCMANHYECTPLPYKVKILRRLPSDCLPVPTVGVNSTTYEDIWVADILQVVVGCECSRSREWGVHSEETNSMSSNHHNHNHLQQQPKLDANSQTEDDYDDDDNIVVVDFSLTS